VCPCTKRKGKPTLLFPFSAPAIPSRQVDNLLNSIGNISTIIGDFQAIVRVDIDVPGFRTNLTVRGESWDVPLDIVKIQLEQEHLRGSLTIFLDLPLDQG
jgi:hypothetical protein